MHGSLKCGPCGYTTLYGNEANLNIRKADLRTNVWKIMPIGGPAHRSGCRRYHFVHECYRSRKKKTATAHHNSCNNVAWRSPGNDKQPSSFPTQSGRRASRWLGISRQLPSTPQTRRWLKWRRHHLFARSARRFARALPSQMSHTVS